MPEQLNPRYYITEIAHSEAYRKGFNKDLLQTETPTVEILEKRKRAIDLGAASLTIEEKSGHMSRDSHVFNVIRHINKFAESSEKLEALQARDARRSEKIPYIRELIRFNHAIKGLVDNDPSLSFSDVLNFTHQMYIAINGGEKSRQFAENVRMRLVGMRHEIGFEQILGTLPNVEYEETDEDGELEGVDIHVHIDSVWVPIDIKASQGAVVKSREAQEQSARVVGKSSLPELIMWSHLTNDDFKDSFRIPYALAVQKGKEIEPLLRQAAWAIKAA